MRPAGMRVPVLIDRENRDGFDFPVRPLRARVLFNSEFDCDKTGTLKHSEKDFFDLKKCYTDREKNGLVGIK